MKRAKKSGENKVDYGTISLPMPLIDKIKKRIEGTGMNSVSAYVAFILRQILSSSNEKNDLNKKEIKEISERLRSLGY
jgi:metal-responsive CopG/Arc/MetJ family transcriptional regulator